MVPELEKPKITEIKVRMDCNGCVQKIKKALYGINGIYDLYIDFPEQKLTIIGWADPERIVKAIKKTRKIATICSHTEQTQPDAAQPTEPPPDPPATAAEGANPSSTEAPPPPQEAAPPEEPPKDTSPPENSQPEATPSPAANETDAGQPATPSGQPNSSNHLAQPSGSRDVGEVHVIHHHPPEYGYRYGYSHSYGGHWKKYQNSQGIVNEPLPPTTAPPVYVTHSYNTYKPTPYVTEYVRTPANQRPSPYAAEYEYVRTPQQPTHYSTRVERYSEEYHTGNNGNITSIFSDENPNACSVM